MKKALIGTLALGSLAGFGLLAQSSPVQASQLGSGILSIGITEGIVFGNNAIDFLAEPGPGEDPMRNFGFGDFNTMVDPGVPNDSAQYGDVTITNLPLMLDPTGGIFSAESIGEFAGKDGDDRSFFNSVAKIVDLVPLSPEAQDGIEDGETIVPPNGIAPLFLFDTDGDGLFGEEDDFIYFFNSFERTVTPVGNGFDVTLNYNGFFQDNAGIFEDTPSVINIFNGATTVDPNDLPVVITGPSLTEVLDQYNDAEIGTNLATTGGGDQQVVTIVGVPEPGTVLGLGVVAGLAGLMKKRNKQS